MFFYYYYLFVCFVFNFQISYLNFEIRRSQMKIQNTFRHICYMTACVIFYLIRIFFVCVKIAAKCNHNFENICYYCILENAEKNL